MKKAKNKRSPKFELANKRFTRRGVVLISVLAVLILLVNVITASYSWFTPKTVPGSGMQYVKDAYLRSEQCSFSTYEGWKRTEYSTGHYKDAIEYNSSAVTSATIEAGKTKYFRTSIINADTNAASDVSVFFASFGQASCNLTVAVTYPSNTVRKVSAAETDYYLIRNAYVKVRDDNDVDGPGLLQVDWFVINNGSSAVTIKLGPESDGGTDANMYLMYN